MLGRPVLWGRRCKSIEGREATIQAVMESMSYE
jgi:hypothetical protein